MTIHGLYDVIIIGGGPAGITASLYAARQKMNALIITREFGGQITRKVTPVENWPGTVQITGPDLINSFQKHLRKHKIDIERDEVSKIKKVKNYFCITTKSKNHFKTYAVIVATGADPRPLEVEGEQHFVGKGVSYCPLCDGPLFYNKKVAVIGGGNSAMEAALLLSKYVNHIYILEASDKLAAFKDNQDKVLATKKAEIITSAKVLKIEGAKTVEKIIYEDKTSKHKKELEVDGIFIEIGNQPATSFLKDLVNFSKRDEIKINPRTCQTRTKGLFACGDVTDVFPKQIVVAAGEGSKAAVNAYNYVQDVKKC
ncbi:MAG: FAD-dependent oxidoreductase [Candidatus Pacebacteria bacterium]|nr:FAD-dependent oxidoreductase [Candidatus Paceibacterota bacterium]